MKCEEALARLQSSQDEFALRYYRWSLLDSKRELDEGFPLVRLIRSSVASLFLEYAENLPEKEVRDLMAGGIKHLNPRGAELAGDSISEDERLARQRFLQYCTPEVMLGGRALTSVRISAAATALREKEFRGEISLQLDKKEFRKTLERVIDSQVGLPKKKGGALRYWSKCSGWFVMTDIDLSGRRQLTYTQQVHSRPVLDRCPTRLWDASLLSWCGIHPTTRFNLIAAHEMTQAADAVQRICTHFLRNLPALLEGLRNETPASLDA
jgi:hypothetical protein